MSEADTQSAILEWLEIQEAAGRLIYWRVPVGGVRHGGVRKASPMKGHPDIAGVMIRSNKVFAENGRYFAIEVKAKGGRFSKEQVEWALKLQRSGAFYIQATDLECVKEVLG